jgi:hypothetical protein
MPLRGGKNFLGHGLKALAAEAVLIAASTVGCQEYALFEPIVALTRECVLSVFVDNQIRTISSGTAVDDAARILSP